MKTLESPAKTQSPSVAQSFSVSVRMYVYTYEGISICEYMDVVKVRMRVHNFVYGVYGGG